MRVTEVRRKEQEISCTCLELQRLSREVCLAARVIIVQIEQGGKLPEPLCATEDSVGMQSELLPLLIPEKLIT